MNQAVFLPWFKKIDLLLLTPVLFMFLIISSTAFCQSDGIKIQFEQMVSEWLGVPVSVRDYKLEYTTLHFTGIKIGDAKQPEMPAGKIEKLSVTCDFMSLLGGKLILNDISLGKTDITLTRNQQGTFFPKKEKKDSGKNPALSFAELPFLNLTANSVSVAITETTDQRFLKVSLKNLKLSRKKDSDKLTVESDSFIESGIAAQAPDSNVEVNITLLLSGMLRAPSADGAATIKKLLIKNPVLKQQISVNHGVIKIFDRELMIDSLNGKWGKSGLRLSGAVKNFTDLSFSISYIADPIILEEFSRAFVSSNGITFRGNGATSGTISGSRKGFNITGALKWPSLRIEAPIGNGSQEKFVFPFKNVASRYSYNGKQMNFEGATAEIFSGKITGNGNLSYSSGLINFAMSLTGKNLRTEQFLGENSSQKNTVSGPVDADFKATGNSSGLGSMNGSGSLTMKNGRYQTPPVVTPLLAMVNLREFASGEIQSGQGTFALESGILHTSDLLFIAAAGKVYYNGQVGLDTSLNGKLNIMFTEEAVSKSRALQQISLDGKTASIPGNVTGTLLSPSFPGFSAEKLLELGLKRTGQKILIDILSPRKKEPENEPAEQKNKEPEKILNDLKKIFKF